jgi:hypothetical protein
MVGSQKGVNALQFTSLQTSPPAFSLTPERCICKNFLFPLTIGKRGQRFTIYKTDFIENPFPRARLDSSAFQHSHFPRTPFQRINGTFPRPLQPSSPLPSVPRHCLRCHHMSAHDISLRGISCTAVAEQFCPLRSLTESGKDCPGRSSRPHVIRTCFVTFVLFVVNPAVPPKNPSKLPKPSKPHIRIPNLPATLVRVKHANSRTEVTAKEKHSPFVLFVTSW